MPAPPIALSTGWYLEPPLPSLDRHRKFIDIVDGFELQFGKGVPERFDVYDRPFPMGWDVEYCSFHLPPVPSPHIDEYVDRVEYYAPSACVLHPTDDAIEQEIQTCVDAGVPVAIENMDIRADCGYRIDELEAYFKTYDIGLVLDVQHVYEHDPSMEYGWDLLERLGDNLVQLHVSGETPDNKHALVAESTNRETILSFVSDIMDAGYNVPMVLEGKYESVSDVEREYTLLDDRLR